MRIDWMLMILALGLMFVLFSFWHAHRRAGFDFNAFDLIMENGKVSKIALAFMVVLAVTTWVVIVKEMKGTLTEGIFGLYGTMWVLPLVAKVVFNKSEMPTGTTMTTTTEKETHHAE